MPRRERTHPHTATTAATTAALADEDGVLPGGSTRTGPARRQAPASRPFSAARIARAGIGAWRCDRCGRDGAGWCEADAHTTATGHRVYTATDWIGDATPGSQRTTRR